jgi:hypothetical protein
MPLSIAQMKINEKWLLNIVQHIKPDGFWMWQDKCEIYYVNSKKQFICKTQKQYDMLSNIVRPIFMSIIVEKTF